MTSAGTLDNDVIARSGVTDAEHSGLHAHDAHGTMNTTDVGAVTAPGFEKQDHHDPYINSSTDDEDWYEGRPTEEELKTLQRVSGKIPWAMFTIAFVELCERFSYYGSSILYTNFVRNPLPEGSNTGSNPTSEGVPGALGMGPQAAQGLSLFNQFFAYIMPLVGAYIADAKLGRFWTLHIAIGISTIAHAILVAASAPGVIVNKDASFGVFIIGLLCLCVGTGFFKANVSPLLAEQNRDARMRVEERKGVRVIVDPAVTNTRVFLYFYLCINMGSLTGQIGMVYVEKYHSFWLAFFIPTVMFLICPFVLWSNKKKYHLTPPTGSVLGKFFRLFFFVRKQPGSSAFNFNWNAGKPSGIPIASRPTWMTYDDAWVDEVVRGLKACRVFLFLPIFFLAYNQMTSNLVSQAQAMELNGVPNDILQNLNPISIVIMIPIIDFVLYPALRKFGIAFTPIKRMTAGFAFSAASMVAAAVMQYYIYKMSPCGNHPDPSECDLGKAPINVWAQSLPYILVGLSEIFTNVTSYEYAFSKAPENMKSLVMSVNLFMSAVSAAIGQAFTPMSVDPLFVWNYTTVACIAAVGGIAFWFCFKHLDTEEDKLNMLKKTEFMGTNKPSETADSKQVDA